MTSYETKTFKGTMKYLKLSPKAKKSNFLEINCSHYQATVIARYTVSLALFIFSQTQQVCCMWCAGSQVVATLLSCKSGTAI